MLTKGDIFRHLDAHAITCPTCGGTGGTWPDLVVAETLCSARAKAGLTAKEVAKRVGVSPQYMADLEHGRRHWSITLVLRYVDALYSDEPRRQPAGKKEEGE